MEKFSKFNRYQEQHIAAPGVVPYRCYVPDYTSEQELYRIDNEPVNLIDNSEINPILQNVAQQQLVDVSMESAFDTSSLSDKELARLSTPRYMEISDIEDIARNNLFAMDKSLKEQVE